MSVDAIIIIPSPSGLGGTRSSSSIHDVDLTGNCDCWFKATNRDACEESV